MMQEFRPSPEFLLAAVALQVIHGIDRYCIAADVVVVVHGDLLGVVCRELKVCFNVTSCSAAFVVSTHYITRMTLLSFHYI